MIPLLNKYFSLNHKLYIPGIGSFIADQKPTILDFANKSIAKPDFSIIYKFENLPIDNLFLNFLCKQLNTDEGKANIAFNEFSNHIKSVLSNTGNFTINGMGKLTQSLTGDYSFEQEKIMTQFFPELIAERVIRKNTEHTVMVGEKEKSSVEMLQHFDLNTSEEVHENVKERWWIQALILAVIGVAAIIFYYWN